MIIYLNAWPNELRRVKVFLPEIYEKIIIVCPLENIDSFKNDGLVVLGVKDFSWETISKLDFSNHKIEKVIADSEDHMEVASLLRLKLGIPGQTVNQSTAFRDKNTMYSILDSVKLEKSRMPETINSISINKIEKSKRYLLKPSRGTDSEGVRKLLGSEINPSDIDFNEYILQEYIPYDIYHVDGIFIDNKISFGCATKYFNTCLEYRSGSLVGGLAVSSANLQEKLLLATDEILSKMPTPGKMIFHAEFFYDESSDDLVFLEIASRSGGGCGIIVNCIEANYGLNITREYFLSECIDGYHHKQATLRNDGQIASYILIPFRKNNTLRISEWGDVTIYYSLDGTEPSFCDDGSVEHTATSGYHYVYLSDIKHCNEQMLKIDSLLSP